MMKPIFNRFRSSINYEYLCGNTHPEAMRMVEEQLRRDQGYVLDWIKLSANPSAMDILVNNPDEISWMHLSLNPSAIELLSNNRHRIDWIFLAKNRNAIDLLTEYLESPESTNMKTNMKFMTNLSQNPNALPLLIRYPGLRCLEGLNMNPNQEIMEMSERYHDGWLFQNPSSEATEMIYNAILGYHYDEWISYVARNTNPRTIAILERYLESALDDDSGDGFPNLTHETDVAVFTRGVLNHHLSTNPAAIGLLTRHPELIDWTMVWSNPEIFKEAQL